jgi:methanogenic corrinoid protein MtbC1
MNVKEEEYTEIKIGRDITREEFMEQFPNVRSVPFFITPSGTQLATYEELKAFVENPVRVKPVSSL